ncbi:MAG: hypothetical protein BWY76_02720 [bacterium ADurb.Bin429]|nr:MAG: hypothetical protein BWY76_02720 [bacterium ADurb.Bin429]
MEADIREGYCRNDDFHYTGPEEVVICPVCGAEVPTLPIGCECDITEEQVDEAIRWHEEQTKQHGE